MSRPVRVQPSGENPLLPYWQKQPPAPQKMTLREQQVDELRRQGTSQEINYGPTAGVNIPKMPTPTTSVITRGVFDSSLYFDSIYKEAANYEDSSIQFQTRVLNNNTDLNNVVQLRLSRFYFPRPTWEQPFVATTPDYLYLRKIYMFIQELPISSSIGTNAGRQYHYELDVRNVDSISTELIPVQQDLYLPTPMQSVTQLTFKFYIPPTMVPIILYPDIMTFRAINATDYAFITATDYRAISTEFAAGAAGVLTTQVGIWFQAITPPVITDALRPQGWFVSAMLAATGTEPFGGFQLSAAPTGIVAGNLCTFQIRKNRVAFEMRFTQMQTPTATGLVPTHK